MARSLVVCPATESLELIEFVESPLGALIHACSRFRPATALACSRKCAQLGRCDLGASEAAFELDEDDEDADTEIDIAPVAETSSDLA